VKPSSIITGLATLLSFGCSDQIPLGVEPSLWMADHETGDLSQWKEGENGGFFTSSDGALSIVESPAHRGRYAVKCSINNINNPSMARLYRQNDLPAEAYYSLWIYIPQSYSVGQYWNVFEFSGRRDPSNSNTGIAVWSLDLRQDSDNQLVWYVYDGIGARELMPTPPVVAQFGRWVQVTAFVRQATDQTGQVTFWIDDQILVDEVGLSTVPSDWMSWAVGSVAGHMPQPAELYLDDAMITTYRPGP
jgi:hypothetical protein